jgi:protein SCO1/2
MLSFFSIIRMANPFLDKRPEMMKLPFPLVRTLSLLLVVGAAVATLWTTQQKWRAQGASEPRPLEGLGRFGRVPDFVLADQRGRQISLAHLKGKVWVANFFYSHCPDTCPIQSDAMSLIRRTFKDETDLLLVSITVDPKRDTSAVLWRYAQRFEADDNRWLFLTGERSRIYRLAQDGLLLGASEIPEPDRTHSGATHTHSPRFVLMDRESNIRGYYPATDRDAMKRLRRDLKFLLKEPA